MKYFAEILNNKVIKVIVVENEKTLDKDKIYIETSKNTLGGVYYDPITKLKSLDQSKAFRKNYAGIGYTYDESRDAFIPPKPYASWELNEESCLWESPVPHPNDGEMYNWNEETQTWDLINDQS